ncbi:MAG: hypothetical protein AAGE94_06530 [Acidobacteriota bacterium]
MSELHAEHTARQAEIEAEEAKVEDSARQRREAEAQLADAQEKQKKYQSQIGQVTTQREYGALLKEIDTVKQLIESSESQAMEAIEANDAARSAAESLRADFAEIDSRYSTELAKWEQEKPAVREKATQLEAKAELLRGEIPRGTLSLYERIYSRNHGNAIAEVLSMDARKSRIWHCAACSYNVRPQVLVEIKGGAIKQCEACKRILYWQEDESADEES